MSQIRSVTLVDPIPKIHSRYEMEICTVLDQIGCPATSLLVARSGEAAGKTVRERFRITVDLMRRPGRLRTSATRGEIYVCWPIFGLLEPILWMRTARHRRVCIVIHDPTPLRRSHGAGWLAAMLGRFASHRGGARIIVHSQPAATALMARGWRRPFLLPHPILPLRALPVERDRQSVVVVGQYKPARDSALLEALAGPLRNCGYDLLISGRGWPAIPGWRVDDAFLSEDNLDSLVARAGCVLVPYREFYQSGIAVRTLELGRPVIGPDHPFLRSLYGEDWPGLVHSNSASAWCDAIAAVITCSDDDLSTRHGAYARRVEETWASFFSVE